MTWIVLLGVLFLAWSNGSNDNFKGVSTLYGSGSASYRTALAWATVTTLAGSLLTLVIAASLVKTFSAKGLVPDAVAGSPAFLGATALGAALTVLAATLFGLPVSTTHALLGALLGAGLAAGSGVNPSMLGKIFVLPLFLSPLLSVAIVATLHPIARAAGRGLGIEGESCVCVGEESASLGLVSANHAAAAAQEVRLAIYTGVGCTDRYRGRMVGLSANRVLRVLHFASAGAVGFARGLNDTPKMVGVLLAAQAMGADVGLPAVAVAMAIGGLLGGRKVAETLSNKIVPLDAGPGLVANLTTAGLVIAASRFGLPVSTTHVATGGLFGIGAVSGKAEWKTIAAILGAWATTLPLGAALGAATLLLLRSLA